MTTFDRRTVLRRTGAVVLAGGLAGCGGSSNGGDGGDGGATATPTPSTEPASDAVSNHLSDTSNFEGSVLVLTDRDSVTVDVGAQGNGGNLAFDPPAIKVSTGTTVTWQWTGEGGTHNVVDNDGAFDSGTPVAEQGHTFEHTFDSSGTYLYHCEPHKTLGMKGAVVVE